MGEAVRTPVKTPGRKKENQALQVQKGSFSWPARSHVEQILFFQRTIGNQAVQRFMKSGAFQAKLMIGAPGDVYEYQADGVAKHVMRRAEPKAVSSGISYIQRACPKCANDELKRQPIKEEDEEEKLQRKPLEEEELQAKATSDSISEMNPDIESNIMSLKGGGQSLSKNERAFFEPRFGYDFGQVRVHTGAEAAESAQVLNARAYTLGQEVVFGAGQYAPGTDEGQKMMAHELTHVIQQYSAGKHIQKQGFKSPISFRDRLFSRWFKLPAALSLRAIIDTQRVPKGCAMPSRYNVYLFNHSTKRYETTVSYEIDKRQTFTWKGLTSGNYQFILRASGNIAVDCKLQGTIEVKHEPAINQIIPVAKGHVGSSTWAYSAKKHPYGSNTNKCNLFIYDVLNQAGASVQMKKRDRGWLKGLIKDRYVYHPPLAGQWANPGVSIPGWIVVKTPQVGDVAAEAIQYSNATGHVGIVSEVTMGGKNGKTISATDKKVVENDWGFRSGQNVVFRRYKGR